MRVQYAISCPIFLGGKLTAPGARDDCRGGCVGAGMRRRASYPPKPEEFAQPWALAPSFWETCDARRERARAKLAHLALALLPERKPIAV